MTTGFDNTTERFAAKDQSRFDAQVAGRLIDDVGDGVASLLPRLDGQVASVRAAEAVLPPAANFLAPDLALIAGQQNSQGRFGWNSWLDNAFSDTTRQQVDSTVNTGTEGNGDAQYASAIINNNYGRFSGLEKKQGQA